MEISVLIFAADGKTSEVGVDVASNKVVSIEKDNDKDKHEGEDDEQDGETDDDAGGADKD